MNKILIHLVVTLSALLTGCATTYTVDDGSAVDEKLLSNIRLYGKAERVIRPSILKSSQLKDNDCDKQWELPFVVATSYKLPKMEKIAWVRGLQVDERLTVVADTEATGLQPGNKIWKINGSTDDADDMLEDLMNRRDKGRPFEITLTDARKFMVEPAEVCRGHAEITKPSAPNAQDYHWLKAVHSMSIFDREISPDEAMWLVLWTQGLSEEANARMKTYHYGMKLVKTTVTLASIASGVGAAANAASSAAAQYAATAAGRQAAQAAGKELARFAAEQAADAARTKMTEAAFKEIGKAAAQEVATSAIRTAAVFKTNLSGVSWIAGSGFYMADKWALDRMAKIGADPLAAFTLHFKLASTSHADNAFVFDEERLANMIQFAQERGLAEQAKLALAGENPYSARIGTDVIEVAQDVEVRTLEALPAPTNIAAQTETGMITPSPDPEKTVAIAQVEASAAFAAPLPAEAK